MWSREIPFKVDIAGVIEIMGSSLYSRLDTPVRELIQNAHDAVMRRRRRDLDFRGRIDIQQDAIANTLTFNDDGIGLSVEEAEQFLGTLGIGITGLLKGRGSDEQRQSVSGDGSHLIGQFGIGLFSGFLLADRIRVESRCEDTEEAVCWEAGAGTSIKLSEGSRDQVGTTVTLFLKPQFHGLAEDADLLESTIKEYADFLTVPIYLNDNTARVNIINASWFQPTPDPEEVELELASYFSESPLDVIPIRIEKPVGIAGALYISPQRTPGFADEATVAVTVRRMVISRRIRELIPQWASFVRGVLELEGCSPTASREDLVRDDAFRRVQSAISEFIYEHLERIAVEQPSRLEAIVNWHRYTLTGASLGEPRLRAILRTVYRWQTSQGQMTFDEVIKASQADPLFESDADCVVWYNADRRQERYIDDVFSTVPSPCVHTLRSFEESLLAAMIADTYEKHIDLRSASPSSANFAESVLGISEMQDASAEWLEFMNSTGASILVASYNASQPVVAFLNERYELAQTFEDLRKGGDIPQGFQRLIDAHFQQAPTGRNEVILNREHRLVQRALKQGTSSPLASVLRLLVNNALTAAGAGRSRDASKAQIEDLDWIAEALWGRD
ncbi:MAG: ATP-binding protein [Planctomycetaceae bacterium]|nr:ATP-binding protein [Planctomycetaceae bacterium]